MVLDPAENFVRGATDAPVAQGDTTISVADASLFVDPSTEGEYNVVVWDSDTYNNPDIAFNNSATEIMRVTARDTNNNDLTVTRGQENTTAISHPNGATVLHTLTAVDQQDIENTFSQFWDSSSQELTANVNNTSVSTDVLNSEDLTQANSGDVVKVGASPPGLTTGPVDAGLWTEDGTISISGQTGVTYTLNGTYDLVLVHIHEWINSDDQRQKMDLIVNGQKNGSYNRIEIDGSTTTGEFEALLAKNVPSGGGVSGTIMLTGRWDSNCHWTVDMGCSDPSSLREVAGANTAASSPLNSFRLQSGADFTNVEIEATVLGRDLP